MFVADKEGKRISAHDKLRLYEFQPQVSSDSNTHRARMQISNRTNILQHENQFNLNWTDLLDEKD